MSIIWARMPMSRKVKVAFVAVTLMLFGALAVLLGERMLGSEVYTRSSLASAQTKYISDILAPVASVSASQNTRPQDWIAQSQVAPSTFVDPWGEQFVIRCGKAKEKGCDVPVYSKGPNKVDEGMGGDDIPNRQDIK
jgi:hypothetical protein